MALATYRGFSTNGWLQTQLTRSTNIELVKRDLLNHIWTTKGERVMMPDFGTRIPLLAFEPNDATTLAIVDEDLREVFNYDPRVRLLALEVLSFPDNNAIIAMADLLYIQFEVRDTLKIEVPTQ
jgi:hypothetical protein